MPVEILEGGLKKESLPQEIPEEEKPITDVLSVPFPTQELVGKNLQNLRPVNLKEQDPQTAGDLTHLRMENQDPSTVGKALLGAGKMLVESFPLLFPSEIERIAKMDPQERQAHAAYGAMDLAGGVGMSRLTPKKKAFKFVGDAAKVEAMFDRAVKESTKLKKTSVGRIVKDLTRRFVDVSGNVKKALLGQEELGRKAVMHKDLIAGASSKASRDINDANLKIYRGLSSEEHKYLDRVIQSRRTLAINKYRPEIAQPEKLVKEHVDYINQLPEDLRGKLNQQADKYFLEMRKILDNLKAEGLIDEVQYNDLVSKGDYSPREFLKHADPVSERQMAGGKISVAESGIKPLKKGDIGLLESDSSLLLANAITRSQTRIFRNRANRALYDLALEVPDNGIVKEAKIIRKTKKGKPVYQPAPAGEEKVSVIVNGQKREMLMPTEMAQEWIKNDPAINQQLSNVIGYISGAKILRPMATGLNPEFALTNLPRDMAHIWLTTSEYSPTLPKFFGQMGKDLVETFGDAVKRKGDFIDYINEGGGMDFLTHQGRAKTKVGGTLGKIQEVMGYLGETTEISARLALRKRAMKNGASSTEATWIARNYLDFNQGGNWAKAIDSGVPYLNASIQGTRGVIRAGFKNPKLFTYKAAQIGTLAASLYMTNKHVNRAGWDSVHPREKVNNWVIMTPYSYKDKEGNKRYLYFKVAKDQGQRVFATLFESLMAKATGDQVDVDQIVSSIEDAIPLMPESAIPPSLEAILGYSLNKDFWRKEDIWRGPQVSPREEWNFYTHPMFKGIGQATGLSPERTKFALSQFFTSGNLWTSMAGYASKELLDQMPEAERHKTTEQLILDKPFIRKVMNDTLPFNMERKAVEQAKMNADTERYIQNRQMDIISQRVLDEQSPKEEIDNFIKNSPREDRKRLRQRFNNTRRLKDVPDRIWWVKTKSLNPEARAVVYWNKWKNSNDEDREIMRKSLRRVPGYRSEKFTRKLNKIKRNPGGQ